MKSYALALLYRDAGAVKRYHTKRTLRTQTVAEHTHGVLMLLLQICPTASMELVKAVMFHDLPELETGDIPAPAKVAYPELRNILAQIEMETPYLGVTFELTREQWRILKWCDVMELVLWCLEELRMGNTYIKEILATAIPWLYGPMNLSTCGVVVATEAGKILMHAAEDAMSMGVNLENMNERE